MIEEIRHDGALYAIVIRAEFREPGIHFFTPDEFSQQLAFMSRPAGYRIQPHFHKEVRRDVLRTQEVLLVRKGEMRVDFFDDSRLSVASCAVRSGDVILLVAGGHGFEMTTDCEIIEIKQGPYLGDEDKVRFEPLAQRLK